MCSTDVVSVDSDRKKQNKTPKKDGLVNGTQKQRNNVHLTKN